jgi:hypothetical protein
MIGLVGTVEARAIRIIGPVNTVLIPATRISNRSVPSAVADGWRSDFANNFVWTAFNHPLPQMVPTYVQRNARWHDIVERDSRSTIRYRKWY